MLDSHRIAIWYRYKTCHELAYKYGVTHDTMRKFCSLHGITDPKLDRMHQDRERALKFRVNYRWTLHEIAEQLDRNLNWVERTLRQAFKAMRSKMRVVYRRVAVQLSLFNEQAQLSLFDQPQLMAA